MDKNEINLVSLEQALIDVEVANKRVIDLTARLASMSRELMDVRAQLSGRQKLALGSMASHGYGASEEKLRHIASSRVYRFARLFSPKLRRIL